MSLRLNFVGAYLWSSSGHFLFSAEKSSLHYTAQLEILFTQPIVTVCVTVVLQLIATTVSLQLKAMHANHAT